MFGLKAQFNFQLFQSYYVKDCLHKPNVARVILGRQEWRRLPSTAQNGNSSWTSLQPRFRTTEVYCPPNNQPSPELSETFFLKL